MAIDREMLQHLMDESNSKAPLFYDLGKAAAREYPTAETATDRDEYIFEQRDGYRVKLPNPNYVPPEPFKPEIAESGRVEIAGTSFQFAVDEMPPLEERIAMALACYSGVTDDRLIAVTDDPTFQVAGIWTPDNTQKEQDSGVVIMCGSEAAAKFPGLGVGRRIVWNFTAGTTLRFKGNWGAKILRYSQVEVILKDDSAMKYFGDGE